MADSIESAKEKVRIYWDCNIPCFVEGPPGVGKSDMFRQLAEERKVGFLDIRLSQMDPVDLRGLPEVANGMTRWTRPDIWPDMDWEGIILFDELADASKAMQSASYQVILDRCAGPHKLPPKAYPCAAGNRRQDRAAAQVLSTALASRFAWIEVGADLEALMNYSAAQGWHHYVRGFFKFKPSSIHNMEGADLRAFPCPRQWEKVSRICFKNPSKKILLGLVQGLVGEGMAGEFMAFLRALDIPDLEEILADPKRCRIPDAPSTKYALSSMLSRSATRDNVGKIMTYITREAFGRDFEIVTVLDAIKRDTSLMHSPVFIQFANRNKDLRLGA